MNTVRIMKNSLRDEYKARRAELSSEKKASLDEKICRAFLSLASYRFSDVILAYFPTSEEIDIRPLLEDALAKGKRVALPRTAPDSRMDFYFVHSLEELTPGQFGLWEPSPQAGRYQPDGTPALMIIPALAYDTFGYRLGYGRGYYDRYINGFEGTRAGLCYTSFLSRESLPRGRFDIAVDFIVTEKGVKLIEKA